MAALNEFKKIIREAGSILARGENRLDTIIGRYLQWLEPRRKKSGPTKYRKAISKNSAKLSDTGSAPLGDLRVKDLLPHHVERYCDFMRILRLHCVAVRARTGACQRTDSGSAHGSADDPALSGRLGPLLRGKPQTRVLNSTWEDDGELIDALSGYYARYGVTEDTQKSLLLIGSIEKQAAEQAERLGASASRPVTRQP